MLIRSCRLFFDTRYACDVRSAAICHNDNKFQVFFSQRSGISAVMHVKEPRTLYREREGACPGVSGFTP